jgi:hypothetical protein
MMTPEELHIYNIQLKEEEWQRREAEKGVHTFSHLFVLNKELKQLNNLSFSQTSTIIESY